MKKVKISKLVLNRETVRMLEDERLPAVAGGSAAGSNNCTSNCGGGCHEW